MEGRVCTLRQDERQGAGRRVLRVLGEMPNTKSRDSRGGIRFGLHS